MALLEAVGAMRPLLAPALLLLAAALATPADAVSFYHYGEGWCGGTAPVASACEAQPTVLSDWDIHISAQLVCIVLEGCGDGQVTVTATATSGTASVTGSCTFTATDIRCTPATQVGVFLPDQEVTLSGSAAMACVPGVRCVGLPAVAEWQVSLS